MNVNQHAWKVELTLSTLSLPGADPDVLFPADREVNVLHSTIKGSLRAAVERLQNVTTLFDGAVEELFGWATTPGHLLITDFTLDGGKRESRKGVSIHHRTAASMPSSLYAYGVVTNALLSGGMTLRHGGIHTAMALYWLLKRALPLMTLGVRQASGLGRVDSCRMSRNPTKEEHGLTTVERIRRRATGDLIDALKEAPELINEIESREFERLMSLAFEELGFHVRLTSASHDGGRDLVLLFLSRAADGTIARQEYYVELKHWSPSGKRVGSRPFERLIEVTMRDAATGAILISTSGFAAALGEDAEVTVRVARGDLSTVNTLLNLYRRSIAGGLAAPYTLQEIADLAFNAIPAHDDS